MAMNNTHGDILYNQTTTTNGPTINDLLYRPRPEDTTAGGHSGPVGKPGPSGTAGILHNDYHRGEVGWICPICGRGLAPSTSYCPCSLTRNITYLNGGLSVQDIAIDCKSTPPEAYYATSATSATTATNKCHDGTIFGAHHDMHN